MEKNSKIFKTQDEEFVQSQIDKLKPINYNKFKWWRRWESKKRELQKNAPLAAKIRNGDLDFPHYYWQAQFCAIEINHKAEQIKDTMSFLESTKMDRARRTHLLDEFEKKETERLHYLEVEFPKEFYMTKTDYYNELESFDGTLMEFYRYCEKKFTKKLRKKERRGRPPKHKEQLDNLVKTIRDL
jgi:hypothetical protein